MPKRKRHDPTPSTETRSVHLYEPLKSLMEFLGIPEPVSITLLQDLKATDANVPPTPTATSNAILSSITILTDCFHLPTPSTDPFLTRWSKQPNLRMLGSVQEEGLGRVKVDFTVATAALYVVLRMLGCWKTMRMVKGCEDGEGGSGGDGGEFFCPESPMARREARGEVGKGDEVRSVFLESPMAGGKGGEGRDDEKSFDVKGQTASSAGMNEEAVMIWRRMAGLDPVLFNESLGSSSLRWEGGSVDGVGGGVEVSWGAAGVLGWKFGRNGRLEPLHTEIEDLVSIPPSLSPITLTQDPTHPITLTDSTCPIFALADGHGGREASQWFLDRIPTRIRERISTILTSWSNNKPHHSSHPSSPPTRLGDFWADLEDPRKRSDLCQGVSEGVRDLDREFCDRRLEEVREGRPVPDDGATMALVCVLPGGRWMLVAHVGDSRVAVASSQGSSLQGSTLGEEGGGTPERSRSSRSKTCTPVKRGRMDGVDLLHVTGDHAVFHSRKARACHLSQAVFRTSRNDPPIPFPENVPVSTDAVITSLINARVFRPESFVDLFADTPNGGTIKSLAMSDALGDLVMKVDPRIFEGSPDVMMLRVPSCRGVGIVIASDGVWGALEKEERGVTSLSGGLEVVSVMERVLEALIGRHVSAGGRRQHDVTPTRKSPRGFKELESRWSAGDIPRTITTAGLAGPLNLGVGSSLCCRKVAETLCARWRGGWGDLFEDGGDDGTMVDDASAVVVWIQG
ncbi:hypothetical protein HDU67_010335, partial [Dinochytrium kinnereticum]